MKVPSMLILLLVAGLGGQAVAANPGPLTLADYLSAVEQDNPDIQAQVEVQRAAKAGVDIAGVRPDPTLSLGLWDRELNRNVQPRPSANRSIGLDLPLELGGKREARLDEAQAQVTLVDVMASGVRQQRLRDAVAVFVEACRAEGFARRMEKSLATLEEIVQINTKRLQAGDIGELELHQSKVERDRFAVEVVKARADSEAARTMLDSLLLNPITPRIADKPMACELESGFVTDTALEQLLLEAQMHRSDILHARAARALAERSLRLVEANRWVDPSVGINYSFNQGTPGGTNAAGESVDPTLPSRVVGLSISVPIPISRLQRGEVIQASATLAQATLAVQAAERRAFTEVRGMHARHQAAVRAYRHYREHVLPRTEQVMAGIQTSYRHGAASLLELLDAQRTANETYLAYLQARADVINTAADLRLATGKAMLDRP